MKKHINKIFLPIALLLLIACNNETASIISQTMSGDLATLVAVQSPPVKQDDCTWVEVELSRIN